MSYDEDEITPTTAPTKKVSPINFGGYGKAIWNLSANRAACDKWQVTCYQCLSLSIKIFCLLAHYHARHWYMHVASAVPLAHHYRSVLAWPAMP
jgi:hypothetical protein